MKKENKLFYGWIIVLGCVLLTMTLVPPIMSLSNKYLLYVTADLGVSRSQFTLTNTIVQSMGIFFSPFVAKNLAKGNMKKIQVLSIIGFCAGYFGYSFATSVWHMYVLAFLVGFCWLNCALMPVSMMVTNWFNKQRGLAMSIAMAGIGAGGTIFSPIVTTLLETYGWRMTYRIMAVIVLAVSLPTALFIMKKKPEDMGLVALGANETPAAAAKVEAPSKKLTITVKQSTTKLFFWLILLGIFCNSIINSGALGQFPPAIQEMHGPAMQAAIISLYSLVGIFGKLALGWINDRFGVIVSSIYGCTCFVLTFILMLLAENVGVLYAMAVLFGLGNAIGTVSPPLITTEVYGKENYAEAYGIINAVSQVGLALGSLMVASIYDASGSYTIAWIVLAVASAATMVGWVGSALLSRKYKK